MANAPEAIIKNSQRIAALAQAYEADMVGFLRDRQFNVYTEE